MSEPVGYLIVGLFGIGMGLAFLVADPEAPTSRSLAFFWVLIGGVFLLNIPGAQVLPRLAMIRFFSSAEALIVATGLEWGLRVMRAQAIDDGERRAARFWVRVGQGSAGIYAIVGFLLPVMQSQVWKVAWHAEQLRRPAFYLFAVPFFSSLAIPLVALSRPIWRSRIDPAEGLRILALLIASPFFIAGLTIPQERKPIVFAIGEVIFLVGAIRYHVVQGRRGQFLARFLSPQVTELVRDRGLASAIAKDRREISVVACDLRGFTAFTESASAEEVIAVLERLYETVGEVATEFGGTIKDFAGDGILVLVGAPIVYPDHVARAVGLAARLSSRIRALLGRWPRLGVGVGVASGTVTVGAIGGDARLEYAAVGRPVNLAARLCARAEAGEVLADERVVASAPESAQFERLEAVDLKGFAAPVPVFALRAGTVEGGTG
jgi:adenylate cyclase